MALDVKVPDIGDFENVPVIEVLVSEGDEIGEEDPLITLESEKATMDVPSPAAGTVAEIVVSEGDEVSEGDLILRLSEGEGGEKQEAEEEQAGDKDEEAGGEADGEEDEEAERGDEAGEAAAEAGAERAAQRSEEAGEAPAGDGPIYASPSVRRIARERGVDLRGVKGSGRKGRITTEDVERFDQRPEAEAGAGITGLELAPWPKLDFDRFGETERVERSRIKRISAPNLARNWVHIPHVTHHDEADITELEAFRKQVNSEQDTKVTMVALLLKACVPVLQEFPEFNASLDGEELVLKRYYHLGFAADTPQGLLVPVIRDVDRKGLLEIAAELIELSGKAREGKLGMAEMSGASFTISSLGGIGGTGFTPIVNAPEVAILGVTRSQTKPVWDGEAFQPRLMLPLSLSYDHRVVDGAAAARFCVSLVRVLSDFRRVLL